MSIQRSFLLLLFYLFHRSVCICLLRSKFPRGDSAPLCQFWCLAHPTLIQFTSPNQRNSSGLLFLLLYQAESSNSSMTGLLEGSCAPQCLLVMASHRRDLPFAGAVPAPALAPPLPPAVIVCSLQHRTCVPQVPLVHCVMLLTNLLHYPW